MRAAFIDIDGTRTRYLYEGSADETLLLVHGFGLSADIWAHVLDPLAAHFTVYAPDILGHGFTDFKEPGGEPAPLVMTRHLEGFMDAVGIERCAVLGSSLGGLLAPLLYAARPESVTALIIDGAAHAGLRFRHAAAGDDPRDDGERHHGDDRRDLAILHRAHGPHLPRA